MPRPSRRIDDSDNEEDPSEDDMPRAHIPAGVFVTVGGKRITEETEMTKVGARKAEVDEDGDVDSEEAYDEEFDGVGTPMGAPHRPDTGGNVCLCIMFFIVGGLLLLGLIYFISGKFTI